MTEINVVTLDLETYDNMVELIHKGNIAMNLIATYSEDGDNYTYIPLPTIRGLLPDVYDKIVEARKNAAKND